MFKTSSFEQEIIEGMEKSLIGNQIENKYSFDKISRAADYLNSAAEILDDTGMYTEAEIITKLLEKIASSKKGKGESAARLHAMKTTGIPFLKNDASHADDDLSEVDTEVPDLPFDMFDDVIDVKDESEDPEFWGTDEPDEDEE